MQSPLALLVSLALIRGLIYLSIFPPFLAPDETAHFEAIRLIGQEKKWPTREVYGTTQMHPEMDTTFEKFRIWNLVGLYSPVKNLGATDNLFISYYPTQISAGAVIADSYLILYHLSVAPISAMMASFDLVTQVYVLRFISILFAALTVIVAWLTVRSIFPKEKIITLSVCSFIVFWPMHSHVTASINTDTLAELIATLFFLILVQTWRKGVSFFRGTMLVSLLGIGILTKPTVFFLVPTLVAVLIIFIGRKLKWNNWIVGVLISLLIVFTWIGTVFLYQNSTGGRKLISLFSEGLRFPNWTDYITSTALIFYIKSLNFAVLSFGGLFGWSNIHIPWGWVRVWAGLLLVVIIGVLLFISKNLLRIGRTKGQLSNFQKEILTIFLLAIIFSIIGLTMPLIVTQSPSWGIHSRYYFPAIVPIILYIFLGVRQLVPIRYQIFLWPGWLLLWVFYDAAIFLFILFPFLYS
ncbi:glycosyltransferase family 39 protein [Chloroflexota bacterium]